MKYHNDVKNGDLLIWSEDRQNRISNMFLKMVRFFTMSEYAHVGIAVWINDELHVVEATIPEIRIAKVVDTPWHVSVPASVWNDTSSSFLMAQVGKSYSFLDCLRAYLGLRVNDNDSWQCAELSREFYLLGGIDLGKAYTPNRVVRKLMQQVDSGISWLKPRIVF